jgi:ArsR family transcriptional regulator
MQLPKFFKALADPTRLRILNLLLEGPLCVCELETLLGLPQPMLSRHLAYLRSAALVTDKRVGMRVQYALAPGRQVFETLQKCLRQALLTESVCRQDLERYRQWRTGCCQAVPAVPPVGNQFLDSEGDML